jgi:hypothetical protein
MRPFKEFLEEGRGLWANIHAKRKRGEPPAKPGDKDYPSADALKRARGEAIEFSEHVNCGTSTCCGQCEIANVVEEKDPRIAQAGVKGFNKPKATPSHPEKSHIVVAKDGDKVKTIRFGEQGAETAGDPKKGESERMKAKRKSFKARHGKNIAKGKMSAAYWADKVKW